MKIPVIELSEDERKLLVFFRNMTEVERRELLAIAEFWALSRKRREIEVCVSAKG